jgi:membrane-bound serine protease (ClpP class)
MKLIYLTRKLWSQRGCCKLTGLLWLLMLVVVPCKAQAQPAEADTTTADNSTEVFVLEIRQEIDARMNRYVKLGLEEATRQEADLILINMDTYGGAVNDAEVIRTRLLEYPKPVWVFINKNAASAGALISIACDSIYMTPGANIGAATVVTGEGSAAPDKYQSYMRSMMRSTAEENNRNPQIAEAMVDASIEIEGVTKAGQVVTFTTAEAIKHGFCDGKARSIEEVLEINGIASYNLNTYQLSSSEKIISFFINPMVSGLLILIIFGGIYFELQTPGVGFPLAAAIVAATLYFVPYYLNGLAENWELLLFIVGIGLIAAEIFVIPGFGIAGISGIIVTFGALMLMMLENDMFDFRYVPNQSIFESLAAVLAGIFGGALILIISGFRLGNSRYMKRVSLQYTMDRKEGYTSSFHKASMIGKTGVAYTVLRPGGKIIIDDEIYDASTRGDYIDKGDKVVVIGDEVTTLRVRKVEEPTEILNKG